MIKKSVKILSVLVIMWLVSLFTIVREYHLGTLMSVSDSDFYERALKSFRNKYVDHNTTNNVSGFEIWQLVEPASVTMDIDDKMSIVISYDKPPGVNGKPVILNLHTRKSLQLMVQRGWKDHAFNQFVSDLIPLNRSLPDVRDDWCKHQNYSKNLPQVSVIICFHNEAWSTLLRTVHSVLDRSPPHLLKEIILFDDFSTMDHLKKPLEEYVYHLPGVDLMRATRREGLIRSRMLAIKKASSPVVLYLDSHCECTDGWLEPLLDRIAQDPTKVVSPLVDEIHDSTFEYIAQTVNELFIGGFNWQLKFKWRAVPQRILKERKHLAEPVKTPTISGGLFAINKDFFAKLGYYDEGFDIWGAENLELSFKAWMCGGSLEIIPCSHVGHIFRKRFPYKGQTGSLKRNSIRLAEVWMDDYAKYYYATIGKDKVDYGNISSRIELRKSLKCHNFQWYLENVYPQLELPENFAGSGQIYSLSNYAGCLDSSYAANKMGVQFQHCHHQGGNQYWIYTKDGELKRDDLCLDYMSSLLVLFICNGRTSSQVWLYDTKNKHIRHMETQKCLQVAKFADGLRLILENCSASSTQMWMIENFFVEILSPKIKMFVNRL